MTRGDMFGQEPEEGNFIVISFNDALKIVEVFHIHKNEFIIRLERRNFSFQGNFIKLTHEQELAHVTQMIEDLMKDHDLKCQQGTWTSDDQTIFDNEMTHYWEKVGDL